jgi:hypothetical protein
VNSQQIAIQENLSVEKLRKCWGYLGMMIPVRFMACFSYFLVLGSVDFKLPNSSRCGEVPRPTKHEHPAELRTSALDY